LLPDYPFLFENVWGLLFLVPCVQAAAKQEEFEALSKTEEALRDQLSGSSLVVVVIKSSGY
jgi:hypothetical protein